ncbi:MAG: radical SAM protein, partial [Lactimicrobium massiliense]
MDYDIAHAAERKAFQAALNLAFKKIDKNDETGYVDMVNLGQKVLGDTWPDEAWDHLRTAFGKDGKYNHFLNRIHRDVDEEYLKKLLMAFGFEAGFTGFKRTQKVGKKEGIRIPWVILFDPTSACNLHCTGCWASEYSHQLNLSYEDMDRIVTEGKQLGIHGYVMTGGEPMVRKNDILKLAKKHYDCGFMIFTNGTLVDQAFCDGMREAGNIVLSMSIEGDEKATDARRGQGTFAKVMATMDLLHKNRLAYGTSICYTRANCEAVTSDE